VSASVTAGRGSVRRQIRIARSPDDVWALAGDPVRITEWWPGIVAATVDGATRVVTTASGIPMPESILTVDRIQRRFQYRLEAPIVREHLSTLDVLDTGEGDSLVVYAADADPATMALIIGGAAGAALEALRRLLEGEH